MRIFVSLKVLVGICYTFTCAKRYVMEPNVFMGYCKRGIASVLSSFGHEQYPSHNLNQNNFAHGVYNVTQ